MALAGVDGPGGIRFDDYGLTYAIGSFALAIILFDGGLRTRRESFRGVIAPTMLLATVGVVITAVLTGLAVRWMFKLETVVFNSARFARKSSRVSPPFFVSSSKPPAGFPAKAMALSLPASLPESVCVAEPSPRWT